MQHSTCVRLASAIGLLCVCFYSCRQDYSTADMILENGVFFTGSEEIPQAEAVAVKNTRILAVGSKAQIRRHKGDRTAVIDVRGGFGCPGFNDAHLHLLGGALKTQFINLLGVASERDIRQRLLPSAWHHGPGDWMVGWGWDNTLFENGQLPDRRMLNRITEFAPILLFRKCGTVAVINQKALSIAGINSDTPNPPGGEIVRDTRTGEPTGIIKGTALTLITQFIPPLQPPLKKALLEKQLDIVRRFGITSIQESTDPSATAFYQDLENEGKLPCRVTLNLPCDDEAVSREGMRENLKGNRLRFGHLFLLVDGCLSTWSAAMLQPYADMPPSRGMLNWTRETLHGMVLRAAQERMGVILSVSGDLAGRMALECFDLIRKFNPDEGCYLLDGVRVLDNTELNRLSEFNVVATVLPAHLLDDMRWLETRLGGRRLRNSYAFRSLKAKGVTLAFGSGWPDGPINPMTGLYAAVSRRDTTGYPPSGWNVQEKISIEEAIVSYTLGSACAECQEKEKGSLEPGKLADIVVLDRNLLTISPLDILKTRVIYTIVGGEIVYDRAAE